MLTWVPAGEVPVTCLRGGFLLARGVVRTHLATGTVLESTEGMFLRLRSDIHSIVNVTSAAFIASIPKILVVKVAISKVTTETQSVGIHDIHVFNTELAMHCGAIFQLWRFSAVL